MCELCACTYATQRSFLNFAIELIMKRKTQQRFEFCRNHELNIVDNVVNLDIVPSSNSCLRINSEYDSGKTPLKFKLLKLSAPVASTLPPVAPENSFFSLF